MNISFYKDFSVTGLLRILNNIRSPSFLLFHFRNIAKCLHKGERKTEVHISRNLQMFL